MLSLGITGNIDIDLNSHTLSMSASNACSYLCVWVAADAIHMFITRLLSEEAIRRGSGDNVTVIIVWLK